MTERVTRVIIVCISLPTTANNLQLTQLFLNETVFRAHYHRKAIAVGDRDSDQVGNARASYMMCPQKKVETC